MIGYSSRVLVVPTHGRIVMGIRSTLRTSGPLLSSKFQTLGKGGIQAGQTVTIRAVTGGLRTGNVVAEMIVVLVLQTVTGMTVVAQEVETGIVTVTVIVDETETEEGVAVTLVGDEAQMTTSPFS
jgi:hypothetical protein